MKKTFKALLIALMVCALFISCESEPKHEHNFSIQKEAVAPTCAVAGHTAYTECACGEKQGYEVIPATGEHNYTATCVNGHSICEACGTAEPGQEVVTATQSDWTTVNGITRIYTTEEGCDCKIEATAAIGSIGPAGGMIFYDCDADNAAEENDGLVSSECGWRYLEAAPTLLKTKTAINDEGVEYTAYVVGEDDEAEVHKEGAIFGYYMKGNVVDENDKQPVDADSVGTSTEIGTSAKIGTGKANTEAILAVKDSIMTGKSEASKRSSVFGALICDKATSTVGDVVYKDWFCPSVDEMIVYFDNIVIGKGYTDVMASYASPNVYYMTSTEKNKDQFSKFAVTSSERKSVASTKAKQSTDMYTLPIRSF